MPLLSNVKVENRPQKILVYGAPKSGKSLMVGQLAEHGYNLYWFDGENGADVLLQLSQEAKERIKLFSIADLKTDPQFIKVADQFTQMKDFTICHLHGKLNCVDCKVKRPEDKDEFKWIEVLNDPKAVIVFDSLSQLVTSTQNHVARNDTFDDFGSINKDSKREWGHYMAQNLLLSSFLTVVQNSRVKIVCISHETNLDAETNVGAKLVIPTGGTSTQSKSVSKYFGHVIHCRVKANSHGVISGTTSDVQVVAGSRLNINVGKAEHGLASIFEYSGNSVERAVSDAHEVTTDSSTQTESVTSAATSQLDKLKAKLNK